MGLMTALIGLVSYEHSIEATIQAQVICYDRARSQNPKLRHHDLLAEVYLARLRAHGNLIIDQETRIQAIKETTGFASLPTATAIRALGLWIASLERPEKFMSSTKYTSELEQIMMLLDRSMKDDTFFKNYEEFNNA